MPMLLVAGYAARKHWERMRCLARQCELGQPGQPKPLRWAPFHCAKCGFRLNKVTLNASDGNAYANNEPDTCPNCNVPMARVMEATAEYAYKVCESQLDRA
jgi:hypothetical protein